MRTTEIALSQAELAQALAVLEPGDSDEQLADYGDGGRRNGRLQLTRGNLACLKATGNLASWLNDEVINRYMQLLNHRAGSCFHAAIPDGLDQAGVLKHYGGASEKYFKAWFCDTLFMVNLYVSLFSLSALN